MENKNNNELDLIRLEIILINYVYTIEWQRWGTATESESETEISPTTAENEFTGINLPNYFYQEN